MLSMSSIEKLVEEASRLPHDQQLTLANRVLELSEADVADDVEDAWDSELRARIQAYDAGRSRTRSAEDVFQRLDSKL
jgi:putative addiction module component (TIGR02574 family)